MTPKDIKIKDFLCFQWVHLEFNKRFQPLVIPKNKYLKKNLKGTFLSNCVCVIDLFVHIDLFAHSPKNKILIFCLLSAGRRLINFPPRDSWGSDPPDHSRRLLEFYIADDWLPFSCTVCGLSYSHRQTLTNITIIKINNLHISLYVYKKRQ